MGFRLPFRRSPAEEAAVRLYQRIVAQARRPEFYLGCGVADTPDGRFDMLALHAYVVLRRLRADHDDTADVAQALFDLMFDDLDQNLREMGVGDIGVSRRIKAMAQGFYGRMAAYDAGLDDGASPALSEALRRNLFRNARPSPEQIGAMERYLRRESAALAAVAADRLAGGTVEFGPPPDSGDGADR